MPYLLGTLPVDSSELWGADVGQDVVLSDSAGNIIAIGGKSFCYDPYQALAEIQFQGTTTTLQHDALGRFIKIHSGLTICTTWPAAAPFVRVRTIQHSEDFSSGILSVTPMVPTSMLTPATPQAG